MLSNLSPKAVVAFALPFVAALILYLLTGDETYLVGLLLALAAGGGAAAAPPAPNVKQFEVRALANRKKRQEAARPMQGGPPPRR